MDAMIPLNPGTSIKWSSTPSYSHSLLTAIQHLPRAQQHRLFSHNSNRTNTWKRGKNEDLDRITKALFVAGNDDKRLKSQTTSVKTRITTLGKSYTASKELLKNAGDNDEHRANVLDTIQQRSPWWDDLSAILHDHPEFCDTDEEENEDEDGYPGADDSIEIIDVEDAMQDVQYHVPAPAVAAPQPAPAPVPAPQPPPPIHHQHHQHQQQLLEDDPLLCPSCNTLFEPHTIEAHLRSCLSDAIPECYVCSAKLDGLRTEEERERHIDECCRGLAGGSGSGSGSGRPEVEGQGQGGKVGGGGGGGAVVQRRKERSRDWAVFKAEEKTIPRDEATKEITECGICYEDYELGEQLSRLSCYCVYHQTCVEEYWTSRPGTFCPMHRDDRPSEVLDVEMRVH